MSFETVHPSPLPPAAAQLLARAREEWRQRQFDAAERSIRQVLALVPNDADALRMLGVAAQRRGDHAGAVDCFRRVLVAWPADADLRLGLGIALYERGEIDEAMTHLRQASKLAPASGAAWFNLGEALWRQAHTEEAIVVLRRALELVPAHVPALLSLAKAQASLGQVEAAVAGFRNVLRLDPGNENAAEGRRIMIAEIARLGPQGLHPLSAPDSDPSFDCETARLAVEKAICADPQLGALDHQIANAYARLMTASRGRSAAALRLGQRNFIAARNAGFGQPGYDLRLAMQRRLDALTTAAR